MSYKVKQFWCNLDLNCPFAWKGDFLGKLTNAAIVYLLRPVMLQSLKIFLSIVQGMRYKVLQFWAQITDLLLKGIFLKNWLMLILSTSCTQSKYYNIKKKIVNVDRKIQGFIIFAQVGLGYFLGKNCLSLLLSI